jgi:hypothetical protein
MNPHSFVHLIFDKDTRNIWWRQESFFKIFLGKLDICIQKSKMRSMSLSLCKYQLKLD